MRMLKPSMKLVLKGPRSASQSRGSSIKPHAMASKQRWWSVVSAGLSRAQDLDMCKSMWNPLVKPLVKHFWHLLTVLGSWFFWPLNFLQTKRMKIFARAQHMSPNSAGLVDLQLACRPTFGSTWVSPTSKHQLICPRSVLFGMCWSTKPQDCSTRPSACPANSRLSRRTSFMRKHSRRAPVQVGLKSS